jgi:flagellar hook-associated protein 2
MAITAAGVGSGLDIENIVSQLMTLERRPLVAIQGQVSVTKARISSYGTLKSAVSSFQDAMKELSTLDAFRKFTSNSSDEDVMTATADADAAAGIYNIKVDRLAQNHKLGSNEFADTATIGGGAGDALTLTVDGNSTTIDLSAAQNLSGLRDAINAAADNPGVTATILNTGDGNQRLILTADESGYDSRLELSYGGSVNAGAFEFVTTNQDSLGAPLADLANLDASYSIDGFALTSATNNVSSALDGLTLELKGEGSSTLALARDNESIEESANAFVDAYNEVLTTIDTLREEGLSGDSALSSIVRSMRNTLNTSPVGLAGSFSALSQLGIKTNSDTGQLEINSSDFADALDTDFASVAQVFANDDQGIAFRFEKMADYLLDDDGLLDGRVDGFNDRIRRLENDEANMERRLELKEAALRAQYSALDSLVGSLQSTSNFLFQNFAL